VDVGLWVCGRLNLDYEVDRRNVKASGANVSSDQNLEFFVFESLEGYLTLILSNVSMHNFDFILDFV
jgi:hypothetical protein